MAVHEALNYSRKQHSGKAEDAKDQSRIETNPGKKAAISGQATKVGPKPTVAKRGESRNANAKGKTTGGHYGTGPA